MVKLHLWVFIILIYLLEFGYGDVIEVPPLNINQKDLMKHLSIVDIKIALPAIYVFDDSFVDNGNNKAILGNKDAIGGGYLPFGIDFDGKPTGRVTNGRIGIDFIATVAGLPYPPPIEKTIRTGVNYASGASRLLPQNGHFLHKYVINFFQQVDLFENSTMEDLKSTFDSPEGFIQYLSKSLFFIHHAGNDLGLTFEAEMEKKYSIDKYAELLIEEFSKQLKRLYTLGARKFFVSNVSPLGCSPFNINTKNHSGPCVEEINNRVSVYNNLLPGLWAKLQSTLPGSNFVLGDIYKVFQDVFEMPRSYGFKDVNTSCCVDNNGTRIQVCAPNIAPCKDRKNRVFFDPFHLSETMHFLWARRFLKDSSRKLGRGGFKKISRGNMTQKWACLSGLEEPLRASACDTTSRVQGPRFEQRGKQIKEFYFAARSKRGGRQWGTKG
ncbi:GDSL esterase/lipase 7-like [Gossypium australe]|uniref:GDSL esterase/lipase 7-like n=1 Tax=Gossypium australe TaxID=47621 RepID=A0A5B6UFV1_9ROSI|nr:GDSL esterase/lipase 7-like [Gossypium australe]